MLHDAVKVLGTCLLWADWQTLFCSSSQCCQTSQNGVVKADCEKCKCSEQFSVPMASAMIQKGLSSASPNFVFFPGHLLIVYVSCMRLHLRLTPLQHREMFSGSIHSTCIDAFSIQNLLRPWESGPPNRSAFADRRYGLQCFVRSSRSCGAVPGGGRFLLGARRVQGIALRRFISSPAPSSPGGAFCHAPHAARQGWPPPAVPASTARAPPGCAAGCSRPARASS